MSKDKAFDLLLSFSSSPKELRRRMQQAEKLEKEKKETQIIQKNAEFLSKIALKIESSKSHYDISNFRVVHFFQPFLCNECETSSLQDAGIYFVHRTESERYLAKDQTMVEVDEIQKLEEKTCICFSCRQKLLKERFSNMIFNDPDR